MFGACAEVLTDQGTEFQREFQEFLEGLFIDHKVTSKDHHEADGGGAHGTDLQNGISQVRFDTEQGKLGYDTLISSDEIQMSRHTSLDKFSPYMFLFAKMPLLDRKMGDHLRQVSDLYLDDYLMRIGFTKALVESDFYILKKGIFLYNPY